MISSVNKVSHKVSRPLTEMGLLIRQRRKFFKITANAASEAAGISRVTLHRIEKGEPSVHIGAYYSVLNALDLSISVADKEHTVTEAAIDRAGWLPTCIHLVDYPQLKELGWHIQGVDHLSPMEAHSIYERNGRFLEHDKLTDSERELIDSLRVAFEGEAS